MILKVCIPILDEGVPPEWTVSLVDNPGFGEARENITQLADNSMVTSSAYIYLVQAGDEDGTAAANFFKDLQRKDEGKCALLKLMCPSVRKPRI